MDVLTVGGLERSYLQWVSQHRGGQCFFLRQNPPSKCMIPHQTSFSFFPQLQRRLFESVVGQLIQVQVTESLDYMRSTGSAPVGVATRHTAHSAPLSMGVFPPRIKRSARGGVIQQIPWDECI